MSRRPPAQLRAHQIKYGRIAAPLGAVDLYLYATLFVLGAAIALTYRTLAEAAAARDAFRDELWDAGRRLEDADELLAQLQRSQSDADALRERRPAPGTPAPSRPPLDTP